MRYYSKQWVPEIAATRRSGNLPLALLVSLLLIAVAGVAALQFSATGSKKVVSATVYIEADLGGSSGSAGTGVLVSSDGHILTNKHVVMPEGKEPKAITVYMYNGTPQRQKFDATLRKYDKTSKAVGDDSDVKTVQNDWAVLKIEPQGKVPYLPLGNSRPPGLEERARVTSVGFPNSQDKQVVVDPKLGAKPNIQDGTITRVNTDEHSQPICLTHSMPLWYGNSGGPLVNQRGELVGINTRIKPGDRGSENYAFPIHLIQDELREYIRP